MQEQKLQYEVVQGEGELPAELIEQIQAADAILFIGMREDGVLNVQGTVKGGVFRPEQDKSHAYVAAIYAENAYLLDVVNGRTTDAGRFRALRDFAVLANTDPARFEVVNGMLSSFELDENMPPETQRTAADHNTFADFLVFALAETEPVLTAPTAAPAEPKFQLRDSRGNVLN